MATTIATTTRRWKTLAVLTSVLSLSIINPVMAQERMLRTLSVTGRGTEMVQTTQSQIRLGVEVQGKTANEVQAEAARRSNSVVTFLRSRKVEKLETTGISLNPTYRYDNGNQTLTGYSASNIVSFRIGTQQAGEILDEAVRAGATRIDSVSFSAADDAIATAQKQALREATQDAQSQADVVLASLGLTKREIVGIQVDGASTPPPRPIENFAIDARQAAPAKVPSPVVGGEQQVEATVTLQISY